MDDLDERDDSKRKTRNLSEKKRRDQFNVLVAELGTMVSPGGGAGGAGALSTAAARKMDKTTVLKSTIAFLRQHGESSAKARLHEIQEDWKPSFLSNEEFTHLMLEALEGFILIFGAADGAVLYVSESVTSLLGHLPAQLVGAASVFDLVAESDVPALRRLMLESDRQDEEVSLVVHLRKGDLRRKWMQDAAGSVDGDGEVAEMGNEFELVKLSGYFSTWSLPSSVDGHLSREGGGGGRDSVDVDDFAEANSDDDSVSVRSHASNVGRAGGRQRPEDVEKVVFVCTAQVLMTRLLRDIPLVHSPGKPGLGKSEFTSRYSLEWKFLYLDHRAPQIIGYLPFELLGTSGYDYYHFDDLDRITQCHEALMQTGEGTSCFHRFLSKGQQWIWLQARYYITYHQWNSKPEFVVATHKVVNYTDVLQDLNGEHQEDEKSGIADAEGSETGSVDVKSSYYPTTGSPTWSSRSYSSTGTGGGVSSKVSDRHGKQTLTDGASSDDLNYHGSSEFESISQYLTGGFRRRHHHHHHHGGAGAPGHSRQKPSQSETLPSVQQAPQQQQGVAQQHQGLVGERFTFALPSQATALNPAMGATPSALVPQPVFIAAPATTGSSGAAVSAAAGGGALAPLPQSSIRSQMSLSPAQLQLQEQLRQKHTELMRLMVEQHEELRRISEHLLMSQYGLVPVGVSLARGVGNSAGADTGGGNALRAVVTSANSIPSYVVHPAALPSSVGGMVAIPAASIGTAAAGTSSSFPLINVAPLAAAGDEGGVGNVQQDEHRRGLLPDIAPQ